MKEITILGTSYQMNFNSDENLDKEESGYCNFFDKVIKIRDKSKMLDDRATEKNIDTRYKQVLRHELLHAFFYESGMVNWAYDEILTEYLATQFPKILNLFEQNGCARK